MILMTLALVALPVPALRHLDAGHISASTFEYQYTLIHSLIMWSVIPQHVPTFMATIGLFLLFVELHVKDIRQSVHFVIHEVMDNGDDEVSASTSVSPRAKESKLRITGEVLYDLVDSTQ